MESSTGAPEAVVPASETFPTPALELPLAHTSFHSTPHHDGEDEVSIDPFNDVSLPVIRSEHPLMPTLTLGASHTPLKATIFGADFPAIETVPQETYMQGSQHITRRVSRTSMDFSLAPARLEPPLNSSFDSVMVPAVKRADHSADPASIETRAVLESTDLIENLPRAEICDADTPRADF